MGSLKRLKLSPLHQQLIDSWELTGTSARWLHSSLSDLQHWQINVRSIIGDTQRRDGERITSISDSSYQANGQKMVPNGAWYVWCKLQPASLSSITLEHM